MRRLAVFWLAMAVVLVGWGVLAGRSPSTELPAGTTHATLFARRFVSRLTGDEELPDSKA